VSDTIQPSVEYFNGGDTDWSFENFAVEKIRDARAREFVAEYHYARGMGNAAMSYGCCHTVTGELVGVIAFHTPISENVRRIVFGEGREHEVTELHRMAIHPDAPANTGTWFISRALDALKSDKPQYRAVLSHADRTEGHDGTVYQAASADYTGTTRPTTFYLDDDGRLRAPRQNGEFVDPDERGWTPEQRDAKYRYVFYLPDEYESKADVRAESQLERKPYP